eukprot:2839363-Pyramimonas_sp.AAC.1
MRFSFFGSHCCIGGVCRGIFIEDVEHNLVATAVARHPRRGVEKARDCRRRLRAVDCAWGSQVKVGLQADGRGAAAIL